MRMAGHMVPLEPRDGWSSARVGTNHIELAVTLRLRDEDGAYSTMRNRGEPWSADELAAAQHGVPDEVRAKLVAWLSANGLRAVRHSPLIIWLQGTFEAAGSTFDLGFEFHPGVRHRWYRPTQEPLVPDWAAPWIAGIVGLENVVELSPRIKRPSHTEQLANGGQGFFPSDLAKAYQFPPQYDGLGQTIGLLEFSNGYSTTDVHGFWQAMGVSAPELAFVSVDGTPNDGGVSSQDMEATLDVEWAGGLAPGAQLVVYEANAGSSDQSFGMSVLKALDYAVHDSVHRPSVLSISYGDAENRFPSSELSSWDSIMAEGGLTGVTTFVASGDQGAYGLHGAGALVPHVDAPADCPHAVAVGGTHLELNADGSIRVETGWTDTNNNGASGGGISQIFAVPGYQIRVNLPLPSGGKPGRGVPDVAANADPDTGYAVLFEGSMTVVGGTSAAAPLWAALWARLNQARAASQKGSIGYSNPDLYDLGPTSAFRDITQGSNSYAGVLGYSCTTGWDAVTGWGSPRAQTLIAELS